MTNINEKTLISIVCTDSEMLAEAALLGQALDLPLVKASELAFVDIKKLECSQFVLILSEQGLALQQTGAKAPGAIKVDFTAGSVDHRRKQGGGKGQMIAKACGLKGCATPDILDMTAGLGKDAFVLASLGCELLLSERSAIVYALLKDGFTRARRFAAYSDPELAIILERMTLLPNSDSRHLILPEEKVDVVYLDPMFPTREKSADVKKEMRAFHKIVGADLDSNELLPQALALAIYRVVVKRPRKAPFLNHKPPSFQLMGKSSRYDIYTLKKIL